MLIEFMKYLFHPSVWLISIARSVADWSSCKQIKLRSLYFSNLLWQQRVISTSLEIVWIPYFRPLFLCLCINWSLKLYYTATPPILLLCHRTYQFLFWNCCLDPCDSSNERLLSVLHTGLAPLHQTRDSNSVFANRRDKERMAFNQLQQEKMTHSSSTRTLGSGGWKGHGQVHGMQSKIEIKIKNE